LDRDNRIWRGTDGNNVPAIKRFLSEVKDGRVPQTLWTYDEVGHTQEAKKELLAAVEFPNSDVVFDTPKPTRLMRRILQIGTEPKANDIVLDFFAGTGTTMDALFAQNAEDGGNRRCILVQLPEPLEGAEAAGWKTIADVTKARVRGAGNRHKKADRMFSGDVGFRCYRLDTSNIAAWSPKPADLKASLFGHTEHIVEGRTTADVLFELLLKLGLDLCVPSATKSIAGKQVHSVAGGVLFACLASEIDGADVEPLADGIVAWHRELLAAAGYSELDGKKRDTTCVFRDSAFADDVAKTNMAAILEQNGIANVRSL